jgi:hypothetical protein
MSVHRIDLVVVSYGDGTGSPLVLLLSQRGRWTLPSAICGQGCQTQRLALALLQQLVGSCPGQRIWLLGHWPPVAAYLALVPAPAGRGAGGHWWTAKEAVPLVCQQEASLIRRAVQWLADGGASRRGIA